MGQCYCIKVQFEIYVIMYLEPYLLSTPGNTTFLSPTVTLLSETTSTADCNVDANYYCLFEEKNSEKTEG